VKTIPVFTSLAPKASPSRASTCSSTALSPTSPTDPFGPRRKA
jgi:hypothetical protein